MPKGQRANVIHERSEPALAGRPNLAGSLARAWNIPRGQSSGRARITDAFLAHDIFRIERCVVMASRLVRSEKGRENVTPTPEGMYQMVKEGKLLAKKARKEGSKESDQKKEKGPR